MVELNAAAITAIVGLLGILFGSLLSPYINHQLNLKNTRRDILFKRKLEYFEKLAEKIEQNIRMYRNAINDIENLKNPKEIIQTLKENRKSYLILASPLYFNINLLSIKITNFVDIEKNIFNEISEYKKNQPLIDKLKQDLNKLINARNEIINEMKKELYRRK
jgi:hypothetical protein